MVLPRKRVKLEVEIDMDPTPGAFNTPESCRQHMEGMLKDFIGHYFPEVRLMEDPIPYPSLRGLDSIPEEPDLSIPQFLINDMKEKR